MTAPRFAFLGQLPLHRYRGRLLKEVKAIVGDPVETQDMWTPPANSAQYGRDASGRPLNAGVYMLRADFERTRTHSRLLVIR